MTQQETEIQLIPLIETSSKSRLLLPLMKYVGRLVLYDRHYKPPVLSKYEQTNRHIVQPVLHHIGDILRNKQADFFEVQKLAEYFPLFDQVISATIGYHSIYEEKRNITWHAAFIEVKVGNDIARLQIKKYKNVIHEFRLVYEAKMSNDKIRHVATFVPITENNKYKFLTLKKFFNINLIGHPFRIKNKKFRTKLTLSSFYGVSKSKEFRSSKKQESYTFHSLHRHLKAIYNIISQQSNWENVMEGAVIYAFNKEQTAVRIGVMQPGDVKSHVKIMEGHKGKVLR